MTRRLLFGCVLSAFVQIAHADDCDQKSSQLVKDHTFKPEVLNSKDKKSQTFGVDYDVDGNFICSSLNTTANGATPDFNAVVKQVSLGYSLKGTVAANKNINPNNFLESNVSGDFEYSPAWGTLISSAFAKYENTQTFDNRQTEGGFSGTIGENDLVYKNTEFGLRLSLGKVDPTADTNRKAITGNTDPYYRWDGEVYANFPINQSIFQRFEYDYRYFKENGPSQQIVAAGLDRFRLETLRLTFNFNRIDGNGLFFIAYATGQLPFDKQGDQIYELGVSFSTQ